MTADFTSLTALWWAVIFSGLYHGINPGMGWPLAVSAGLMQGKNSALPKALLMLALGHLLAMLAILLPFSLMTVLLIWETQIRIGAGPAGCCDGHLSIDQSASTPDFWHVCTLLA